MQHYGGGGAGSSCHAGVGGQAVHAGAKRCEVRAGGSLIQVVGHRNCMKARGEKGVWGRILER